jgi:hypothetical protein
MTHNFVRSEDAHCNDTDARVSLRDGERWGQHTTLVPPSRELWGASASKGEDRRPVALEAARHPGNPATPAAQAVDS